MKAYFIRHLAFEDGGSLEDFLREEKYEINYLEAVHTDFKNPALLHADIVVSLGGPISANDTEEFPFLLEEMELLKKRMNEDCPTLGICLGAQLMACALGSKVFSCKKKEIGWFPIALTSQGESSILTPLKNIPVLHWHGEMAELPTGCERLAFTEYCSNQAFQYKKNILALQFHLEAEASRLESWFVGHIGEITQTEGVSVLQLRKDTQTYAEKLKRVALPIWRNWIRNPE